MVRAVLLVSTVLSAPPGAGPQEDAAEVDRPADVEPVCYTAEQVERGEYPPLLSLLSPDLASEVAAARVGGEPLYTPRLRSISGRLMIART